MVVLVFVGFHALEAFEGVVEDAGCGVEGEVLVGSYSRREPARGGGPFYCEHVVCIERASAGIGPIEYYLCLGRGFADL